MEIDAEIFSRAKSIEWLLPLSVVLCYVRRLRVQRAPRSVCRLRGKYDGKPEGGMTLRWLLHMPITLWPRVHMLDRLKQKLDGLLEPLSGLAKGCSFAKSHSPPSRIHRHSRSLMHGMWPYVFNP